LRKTAIIARERPGLRPRRGLRASPVHGALCRLLDDRAGNRISEKVLGPPRRAGDYVRAQNIDIIYIALPMASQPASSRSWRSCATRPFELLRGFFVFDLIRRG